MATLEAGRLRHRVLIQQNVDVLDSNGDVIQDPYSGEVLRTWEDVATVWAAIEPLSAREFLAAQAVQSKVTTRITIRYRPGMNAAMRLRHGTTIYNIAGVIPDPDSLLEWLTLPCSSGVSDTGL